MTAVLDIPNVDLLEMSLQDLFDLIHQHHRIRGARYQRHRQSIGNGFVKLAWVLLATDGQGGCQGRLHSRHAQPFPLQTGWHLFRLGEHEVDKLDLGFRRRDWVGRGEHRRERAQDRRRPYFLDNGSGGVNCVQVNDS